MKNRLLQISKGNMVVPVPEIRASQDRLQGIVMPDKILQLSVDFVSENKVPLHLFFYAPDPRISVSKNINIAVNARLTVEINSRGLTLGDQMIGVIYVLYNGGEIRIPYEFTVGMSKDGQSVYAFETVKEFSEYAETNFTNAVQVFSWKEFLSVPFMRDMHFQGLYQTYYSGIKEDAGLGEFLYAAGVPLPAKEKEKETRDERNMRMVFTPAGISKSEIAGKNYRLAEAFLKTERMRHAGLTVNTSIKEISALLRKYPEDTMVVLFEAYVHLLEANEQAAKEALLRIQDEVQKERIEKKDIYCAFLYLASVLQDDKERIVNAGRLIQKYWQEGECTLLMALLQYRVNYLSAEEVDKKACQEYLRSIYVRGITNTLVLFETAILWQEEEPEIPVLSDYELTVTLFALRKNLLTEKRLFQVLGHELKNPSYLALYMEVLKEGYYKFRNIEILHAILNVMIQKKWLGPRYFMWYSEAILREMTVPGLYECYLQSVPKEFTGAIPRRVVSYFGLNKEQSDSRLAFLYHNVLTAYANDEEIRDLYDERIEKFAYRSMRDEVYNMYMKPIYEMILDSAHLDEANAKYMLQLFSLCEVETTLSDMKRIVVHYPQLDKEDSYELTRNHAIVPIFSEEAILAFEDEKGFRHFDPDVKTEQVFNDPDLQAKCMLYVDDSLLLKLHEADRIVKEGVLKDRDLFMVTEFIQDKRIQPFYRSRLYETLIDLSLQPNMQHIDCSEFLLTAEFKDFSKEYKTKLLQSLTDKNYTDIALEKVITYGAEGLTDDALLKLMESAVRLPLMQGNDTIIAYCYQLFRKNIASVEILEFLGHYFTCAEEEMMSVLRLLHRKHRDASDLIYRAFQVAFFTQKTRDIDMLFDWYNQEKQKDETVVKAYLVFKSHVFFKEKKKLSESVIPYLVHYRKTLPPVVSLALITWYSVQNKWTEEDSQVIIEVLEELISKNVYLECYRKFISMEKVPFELLNRMYVEYRDDRAKQVSVTGFVMPGRHYFHRILSEVYPGVFVQSFMLYKREWLEFRFRVIDRQQKMTETETTILTQEDASINRVGRMDDLLNLEKKIDKQEDRDTAEALKGMLFKEGMTKSIFGRGN